MAFSQAQEQVAFDNWLAALEAANLLYSFAPTDEARDAFNWYRYVRENTPVAPEVSGFATNADTPGTIDVDFVPEAGVTYEIGYTQDLETQMTSKLGVTSSPSSVTGLTAGLWKISIRAYNDNGAGPWFGFVDVTVT